MENCKNTKLTSKISKNFLNIHIFSHILSDRTTLLPLPLHHSLTSYQISYLKSILITSIHFNIIITMIL